MLANWGEGARLRAQHPHEPWLWRRDWSERCIRQSSEVGGWCLWGFALVWNLFCLPIAFFVPWQGPWSARTILLAAFPISGALLLLLTLYQALRRRKYGISLCRIDRSPVPLGSTLRGEVEVRLHELPPEGFTLRLVSARRTVHGSGKNRSVHESILWQDEQTVTHGAMPSPNGLRVPFRFDIPYGCEPCDFSDASNTVVWRLHVSAEVPGIDYDAAFELPVFRTADSRDEIAPAPHSAASWQPPREIVVTPGEIVVRSPARAGDWIAYLFFFPLWFGALALFYNAGVPLGVPLFFGAIGTVALLSALNFLLGRTTVTATGAGLTIRRSWLGLPLASRTIPTTEIVHLEARLGGSRGNRGYHAVVAVLRGGRTRSVARHLRIRRDAEMLAERLTRMLGR